MRITGIVVALGLTLGACASAPAQTTAAGEPAPTRAEKLAKALENAAANGANDSAALAHAVRLVDATGAVPLDAAADPVPGWRAAAGAAVAAEPPVRGRPLGPGYRSGRIAAGGRDSFAQLFLSGTASTIALSAPTGDRVALTVLDKDAQPVCKREAIRTGACRWVPLFTQRYTIEVANLGGNDARYFLVIE